MFSFLRRPSVATDEVKATEPGTKVLCFDPATIVRAITFHLLDEGKAHCVNPQSSEAAIQKLCQRSILLAIPADRWATMENVQRLQWLLAQSRIVVKPASSGSAKLAVRR
jgi:hypothetical protein